MNDAGIARAAFQGEYTLPEDIAEREARGERHAASVLAACKPNPAAAPLLRAAKNARSVAARVLWLQRAASAWAKPLEPLAACARGCTHCCHIPVAITDVEARLIGEKIGRPPAAISGAPSLSEVLAGGVVLPGTPVSTDRYASPCPFLRGDECSIYQHRPIACRTQVNLDVDARLCELRPGVEPKVPYADATVLKAAYVMAQPAARWADVRAFFPAPAPR